MNVRVDPATLFAPKAGDNDAALIALCRVALRALDRDIELDKAFNELTDQCDRMEPPYPKLPWMYAISTSLSPKLSSARLRQILREGSRNAVWRSNMRLQIAAVAQWERDCARLRRSTGLTRVARQYERAIEEVEAYVFALPSFEAQTVQGAAFKSLVITSWLRAGYELENLGKPLAMSILDDVRRLGAVEHDIDGRRSRRAA